MKILVTGASGQLGYDVCEELKWRKADYIGTSSRELDITDSAAVEQMLQELRPDAVIHCAAYTKVDQAEDEPERCWAVNAEGTKTSRLPAGGSMQKCCTSPRTMYSPERENSSTNRRTQWDR